MTWQPPDLGALNAKLAQQNQRVGSYLEGVFDGLDRLIDAALAQDWEGVRRCSLEISRCSRGEPEADVVASAERVLEAAERAESEAELKRRVLNLIAVCGKAQRRAKIG